MFKDSSVGGMRSYSKRGDENTLAYHSEILARDIHREEVLEAESRYSHDVGMCAPKASRFVVKYNNENPCKERQQFNRALANGLYGEECKNLYLEDYYGN